jgi:hypothetical protein
MTFGHYLVTVFPPLPVFGFTGFCTGGFMRFHPLESQRTVRPVWPCHNVDPMRGYGRMAGLTEADAIRAVETEFRVHPARLTARLYLVHLVRPPTRRMLLTAPAVEVPREDDGAHALDHRARRLPFRRAQHIP